MTRAFGYRAALRWLAFNDDCLWLTDEFGSMSVTACFIADCYGKSDDQVKEDLARIVAKRDKERLENGGIHV
jgi:hypothetical protein